jgi:beta-galactosidase
MKHKLILLLPLFFALQSFAQQQLHIANALDSNWEFLRQNLGGVWEAVRPVKEGNPESVPLWEKVTLPHCVNARDAVDPDVNYYQVPAWYRTELNIENRFANGRTLLHFEGAGQKTDVYIYTTKVGSHVGGYDEWKVDITEAVEAFKKTEVFKTQFKGKVPLVICTDNSRDLELIPSNLSDFNLYGGLYRYVHLLYKPDLSVDHVLAQAEVDKQGKLGKIRVRAKFHDPSKSQQRATVFASVYKDGKLVGRMDKTVDITDDYFDVGELAVKNPKLWSPEKPELYTVEVALNEVKDTVRVGFRHFEFVKKGPFLLNGKRLLLRGTHRHEDHAGVGAAMTAEMMREEMKMMKEMGVNFIRLGHYQQSRIILDLCDELGILVWEEIPWCRGGLGGEVYKQRAREMLVNMIQQHYNHPSVIIWGLGNENDWPGDFPEFDKEKIRTFMKELNGLSHKLDSTRKTAIRRCDFCKDIVDVGLAGIGAFIPNTKKFQKRKCRK